MRRMVLIGLLALLTACGCNEKVIEVAASGVPHAEILEMVKSELSDKGYELKIVVIDDYHLPNRLLAEKQIDANFFQHIPFLQSQEKAFGYTFCPLAYVHIEPMGIYSKKIKQLDHLREEGKIAIPSDPTNEKRALLLLEQAGLIALKKGVCYPTVLDITANPLRFKFEEIDAPLLTRSLRDVDIAVIPANFVLQASLSPSKDALLLEKESQDYANVLVVRKGEEKNEGLQALREALTSEKMRGLVAERYHGAILLLK